ncbi:hypothetical protein [Ottowia sp.]|uniref:hypothetical protein n=1 Tax=Ottowia sp. TaxID=1898956 RepID=UPI003A841406
MIDVGLTKQEEISMNRNKTRATLAIMALVALPTAGWASKCDGVDAHGQTGGAYFSRGVPYEEDVLSFCSIGVPAHCWVATGPGTWTQTCPYLIKKWIPKFEEVCVHGQVMGAWDASSGRQPLSTKGDPSASDGMAECEHGDDF